VSVQDTLFQRDQGKEWGSQECWVLISEAERLRIDKELKAKDIKCVCAVCIEWERNSFTIQKNIAGEIYSRKKTGIDAKSREMGKGCVLSEDLRK
jgi:hypothetical protein